MLLSSVSNATIAQHQHQLQLMPGCRSCSNISTSSNNNNNTSNFLHAIPFKHDPYTPDSMDSPSPNTLVLDLQQQHQQQQRTQSSGKHQDRAVSPALLKSKLELIAQGCRKNRTTASSSTTVSNSESDNDPNESGKEDNPTDWGPRKSRSNSDVSWQRSHLLTKAWLQGKEHQAYHSFSNDLHREESMNLEIKLEDDQIQPKEYEQSEIVIPKIAIINPSNFVSNASSVHHLHSDENSRKRCNSLKSDQYLDAYTNQRTRSLSEADSGSATVEEELCLHEGMDNKVFVNITVSELPNEEIKSSVEDCQCKIIAMNDVKTSMNTEKSTSRSDSVQGQDFNADLKLKAYNKVTERCKRNIAVSKKNRCSNRCCVLL